jgi:hypothetical protein
VDRRPEDLEDLRPLAFAFTVALIDDGDLRAQLNQCVRGSESRHPDPGDEYRQLRPRALPLRGAQPRGHAHPHTDILPVLFIPQSTMARSVVTNAPILPSFVQPPTVPCIPQPPPRSDDER